MIYVATIEDNKNEEVEVTVNFGLDYDGTFIESVKDSAGNDVMPFDQWALEMDVHEYYSDIQAEKTRFGR